MAEVVSTLIRRLSTGRGCRRVSKASNHGGRNPTSVATADGSSVATAGGSWSPSPTTGIGGFITDLSPGAPPRDSVNEGASSSIFIREEVDPGLLPPPLAPLSKGNASSSSLFSDPFCKEHALLVRCVVFGNCPQRCRSTAPTHTQMPQKANSPTQLEASKYVEVLSGACNAIVLTDTLSVQRCPCMAGCTAPNTRMVELAKASRRAVASSALAVALKSAPSAGCASTKQSMTVLPAVRVTDPGLLSKSRT
mmetsp:Transcript_125453/g.267856  ORF Transcript_125453/g.267856 Transcript_125453/m.267856 type:complete len:251 (+) Transcript_125453:245-997(+)